VQESETMAEDRTHGGHDVVKIRLVAVGLPAKGRAAGKEKEKRNG
jgi:hypothetical protein